MTFFCRCVSHAAFLFNNQVIFKLTFIHRFFSSLFRRMPQWRTNNNNGWSTFFFWKDFIFCWVDVMWHNVNGCPELKWNCVHQVATTVSIKVCCFCWKKIENHFKSNFCDEREGRPLCFRIEPNLTQPNFCDESPLCFKIENELNVSVSQASFYV